MLFALIFLVIIFAIQNSKKNRPLEKLIARFKTFSDADQKKFIRMENIWTDRSHLFTQSECERYKGMPENSLEFCEKDTKEVQDFALVVYLNIINQRLCTLTKTEYVSLY